MTDICPVCGKGEREPKPDWSGPAHYLPPLRTVSHLDCVLTTQAIMTVAVAEAEAESRTYQLANGELKDKLHDAEAELATEQRKRRVYEDASHMADSIIEGMIARRCDGCLHWDQTCVGPEFGECVLGVADDPADTTCADFACKCWEEK